MKWNGPLSEGVLNVASKMCVSKEPCFRCPDMEPPGWNHSERPTPAPDVLAPCPVSRATCLDSVASTILDGASMQTEKKIPSPHQPHPLYHRGPFQPLRLLESFLIAVAIQKPASPTQAP